MSLVKNQKLLTELKLLETFLLLCGLLEKKFIYILTGKPLESTIYALFEGIPHFSSISLRTKIGHQKVVFLPSSNIKQKRRKVKTSRGPVVR
jgi:hypothetical protein